MTRRVDSSEQGQLQGAVHGLRGVSGMIGPGLFTITFAFAIGVDQAWRMPGAPFLLAALLLVGAMLLAWRVTRERQG
jgi:DHA1 family tetracycline resistance protein-like MFS transporter